MKKKKTINSVEPIVNQSLREVIRDSDFSIQELATKAGINRSGLQNFYQGKADIKGSSISKILNVLPYELKEQFSTLILQ